MVLYSQYLCGVCVRARACDACVRERERERARERERECCVCMLCCVRVWGGIETLSK
jgi:hypothetical protein